MCHWSGPNYLAGMWGRGFQSAALLLPWKTSSVRELPHVPGANRPAWFPNRILHHQSDGRHGDLHRKQKVTRDARTRHGVHPSQPPARLSHLRPGRWVWPTGPITPVRLLIRPVQRVQTSGWRQRYRTTRLHAHEQMHSVFKMCKIPQPVFRQLGFRYAGPRECITDWHLDSEEYWQWIVRQYRGFMSSWCTHQRTLLNECQALGTRAHWVNRCSWIRTCKYTCVLQRRRFT